MSTAAAVAGDGGAVQAVEAGPAAAAGGHPAAGAAADGDGGQQGQHYNEVADNYEAAFFYSSVEYRDWVLGHLLRHFGLPDEGAEIVDLGGGTGNFTQALAEAARCRRRVLCVDAFAEMLQKALAHDRVEPMLMDAVAFAALPPSEMRYSHVLLKELVHHIPAADVPAMYAGLAAQLAPGGVAVTITRPQEVDYPLFARAREIWKEHQPHHSVFVSAMEAGGLEVEVHAHDYRAELPKSTWLAMMRARFWSTFSHCTPEELEQGIAEVEAQYAGQDTVHFTDRLLFLVARKPANGAAVGADNRSAAAASADNSSAAAAAGATVAASAAAAARQQGAQPPRQAGQQQQQQQQAVLTPAQWRQYSEQGFTGPVTILSPEEAAELRQQFERYEARLGGKITGDWRFKSHLLLPAVWDLVRHPAILAAVSDALGGCRNLLCWSTDIFKKEPGDGGFTGWHQDSTYVGLDPPDVVTVWLALTPANAANGALHFLPGSHRRQLPHVDTFASGNLLLKGQTIPELRGEEGVCTPLQPGQATLHHIMLAHRSGPAAPDSQTRLGLAIRYMAAHVQQSLDPRDSVTVVAGRDTFGHYRHEAGPAAEMDAAALEQHRAAVQMVYPDGFERSGADAVNMADSEAMLDSGTLGALEDLRAASDVLEEEWRPGSSITTWKRVKLESEIDVVELFLNEASLLDLPDSIGSLAALRKLRLNQNALRSLPPSLTGLHQLQALWAAGNVFREVPQVVCQLTQLEQLFFSLNPLQALPPAISQLQNLEWLDFSECQLAAVPPEIGALTHLQRLDLHSNKIATLPETISNLRRLDHLSLHSNDMTLLPPEIGACTALTWLSLNANKLRVLPPSIGQLTNMVRLSLHINQLEHLPPELGNLVHLEALSLHSNELPDIPPELGRLTECVRLSLYQNRLTSLPPEIGQLTALQELWLYSNQLTSVPRELAHLTALKRLWLDRNQLTSVPAELAQLTNLQELYLDQNPGLKELPSALALLPALRRMYVASTPEAQAALQAQAAAAHQMPGGRGPAAAAVAAGVIGQSRPFT